MKKDIHANANLEKVVLAISILRQTRFQSKES